MRLLDADTVAAVGPADAVRAITDALCGGRMSWQDLVVAEAALTRNAAGC